MEIYEPSEDSFLILKHVRSYAKGNVLDMGTGSGVLGLEALKNGCEVLCVDVNKDAVALVKSKGLDCLYSDLFSNVDGSFDLIMFNPPYLPKEELESDEVALYNCGGLKGCEVLDMFFNDAYKYLCSNGKVLFLFSSLSQFSLEKHSRYSFKMLDSLKLGFEELYVYLAELNI